MYTFVLRAEVLTTFGSYQWLFFHRVKALFHSSQNPTRKLIARTLIQSQYLKALAASLRVSFRDEWKEAEYKNIQHQYLQLFAIFTNTVAPRFITNS